MAVACDENLELAVKDEAVKDEAMHLGKRKADMIMDVEGYDVKDGAKKVDEFMADEDVYEDSEVGDLVSEK
eukprot:4794755-Amphidinium_carterae.1